MQLPEDDQHFLNAHGYSWTVLPDGAQAGFLIVKGFDVSGGGFGPSPTDLMVRIPAQYNMAQLDMWYCDPPIRYVANSQFAPASEVTEQHMNRMWQRFSRHLVSGAWRPGVDNLRSFMPLIWRELQGRRG